MSNQICQTTVNQMLAMAREAQNNAYAPYSNFYVGACVKTSSGEFFSGCNIENVSYSLTVCAEVSALCSMITSGHRHISEVLLVGSGVDTCPPCGACRQMLYEFSQSDTLIHLCNQDGLQHTTTVVDLLPAAFNATHMEEVT